MRPLLIHASDNIAAALLGTLLNDTSIPFVFPADGESIADATRRISPALIVADLAMLESDSAADSLPPGDIEGTAVIWFGGSAECDARGGTAANCYALPRDRAALRSRLQPVAAAGSG
jgi:hypothetical protein